MPSRSERLLTAVIAGVLLFLIATPAEAAETTNSEFVIIREGEVFPDDLYAGAVRVVVEGTIDGDLIAFAAEEVVINGTVTGSVTALTPTLSVAGEVEDSVRMTGNRLAISGHVGGDVVSAAVSVDLARSSRVDGDVLVWAWNASALGSIGMDLTGTQRNFDLAGAVDGDVDVTVHRLTVVDTLTVGGDIGYRSDTEADGLELATVGGAVVDKDTLPPNLRVRAIGLLARILAVVVLSVAAASAAYGWPGRTSKAIALAGSKPFGKWLRGASIVFAPLIAVVVTGLILGLAPAAVAFPLLAVLVPAILALVGVALVSALVAGAPVAGWLGGVVFKRLDLHGAVFVGSLVVGVLWWLPVVGWLVPLIALPWGMGAWMTTWSAQPSEPDVLPSDLPASSRTRSGS